MPSIDADVLVIGAGAAGLAAFHELDQAGFSVLCLEARGRVGGRIYTVHDPLSPVPIELGAEFIHGRPPEIWDIIDAAGLTAYDVFDRVVRLEGGKVQDAGNPWQVIEDVIDDMRLSAAVGRDRSFLSFLQESSYSEEAKQMAASYVEGFNAARKEVIGIASLAQDAEAAEQIDGNRSFRLLNGYESVVLHLLQSIPNWRSKLRLNTVVEGIEWQPGTVSARVRTSDGGRRETLQASRSVVTAPLGVLLAEPHAPGAIQFDPQPSGIFHAARALRFGQVLRIVFRFREAVWRENPDLAEAGFLLSNEAAFPVWWTPLAVRAPFLTAWSAGPHCDALLDQPESSILAQAREALARITCMRLERIESQIEATYFHDWHRDPFARGAYSYAPAGALGARKALAEPVADTLYFAGEAAETSGYSATVHGAIASGRRAARQISGS